MSEHKSPGVDPTTNAENPYLAGPYAPVPTESELDDLEVIGELPKDLFGVYVRNGPNPRHPPRGRYHWFDGDGMLHAVSFANGRARYHNRWVGTRHLARDNQAGRSLWTGLLHPVSDNPTDAPYKDTANTDILVFGDRLLATWYICGQPYKVDPATLETHGIQGFETHDEGQAKMTRQISAHAKVDPVTGELLFFSYGKRPELIYGQVAATGELTRAQRIPLPGPRLPHDMAITENYSILMDLPLFYTAQAMEQKRWRIAFHRDMPARFALVPRAGANQEPRWFEAEPCYIYHTINAWEEDDEVVLIACRVTDPIPEPDYQRDGQWARMMANLRLTAHMHEWRFNLTTGETREKTLDDRNSEFPCINAGRMGRPTRYSYNASLADAPTLLFDGLIKYDCQTGAAERHEFGPGRYGSEAVHAARNGASGADPAMAEDDGYVVTIVSDAGDNRAEAQVFLAADIPRGPVARVVIPRRVPLGFHACWMPGQSLG